MRGSTGFAAAVEEISEQLGEYGLSEFEIISLPADGEIFYGTQRSRPAWNARSPAPRTASPIAGAPRP